MPPYVDLDTASFNDRFIASRKFDFKPSGISVTIEQTAGEANADEHMQSAVWGGGALLADVIQQPDIFPGDFWKGKNVIELGAGCGTCGITAAACGAASVTLTDYEQLLPLLQRNVQINGVYDIARTVALEWEYVTTATVRDKLPAPVDVILGAEITCFVQSLVHLRNTLEHIILASAAGGEDEQSRDPSQIRIYLAHRVRGGDLAHILETFGERFECRMLVWPAAPSEPPAALQPPAATHDSAQRPATVAATGDETGTVILSLRWRPQQMNGQTPPVDEPSGGDARARMKGTLSGSDARVTTAFGWKASAEPCTEIVFARDDADSSRRLPRDYSDGSKSTSFLQGMTVRVLHDSFAGVQTAGHIWSASRHLARRLYESPSCVRGKRVLELGCGLALPSLVAACLGATRVVATDAAQVGDRLNINAKVNGCGDALAFRQTDFTSQAEVAQLGAMMWDVVLFADCCYMGDEGEKLPHAIALLLGRSGAGCVALGAFTRPNGIPRAGESHFWRQVEAIGMAFEQISPRDSEWAGAIYRFRLGASTAGMLQDWRSLDAADESSAAELAPLFGDD